MCQNAEASLCKFAVMKAVDCCKCMCLEISLHIQCDPSMVNMSVCPIALLPIIDGCIERF